MPWTTLSVLRKHPRLWLGQGYGWLYQGLQILWPDAIGTAGPDPVQFKHLFLFCCFF